MNSENYDQTDSNHITHHWQAMEADLSMWQKHKRIVIQHLKNLHYMQSAVKPLMSPNKLQKLSTYYIFNMNFFALTLPDFTNSMLLMNRLQ